MIKTFPYIFKCVDVWISMLQWNRTNTLKRTVPNVAGIYKFYDSNRRLLYVGHAKHLRHRIQSYREVDDLQEHPTKAILRPKISFYQYVPMPLKKAEAKEKVVKKYTKYNYL